MTMGRIAGAVFALALCGVVQAAEFELPWGITGNTKSLFSMAMGWRADSPDGRLLFKLNRNPGLCKNNIGPPGGNTTAVSTLANPTAAVTAGCLSFTGDQSLNQKLVDAPGAYFGANRDDGDYNYPQWGLVAALAKLSSDVTLKWEEFTIKAAAVGYFDQRNFTKNDLHPDTTYQPSKTGFGHESAQQGGRSWVLRDLLVTGKFSAMEHEFTTTVGYQHIRWGESTLVALNSISEINAPDARLLYQPATQIADVFRPTPAILLGTQLTDSVSIDLVYLLGWDGVQLPDGGQFAGPVDVVGRNVAYLTLGQFHEDPNHRQRAPGVAADVTDTDFTIGFRQVKPQQQGQFGFKLNWFASELNGGTEFNLHFLNYHSRFPYFGADAAQATCVQPSTLDFFQTLADCNGTKLVANGLEPFPANTAKARFDYPENIQMLGLSFNTNFGKWSLAGEFSYRPNVPAQVSVVDTLYAAEQPAAPAHDICLNYAMLDSTGALPPPPGQPSTCTNPSPASIIAGSGTLPGILASRNGQDLINSLALSPSSTLVLPSAEHILPSYLTKYRGIANVRPGSHIAGYERLQVLQFDFTGIRALGATDNPIGADQVILITEVGGTWAIDMPSRKRLQFEGFDLNDTHYSAGADGSCDPAGTARGYQPDGAYAASRLNPHCQRSGFATPFATGYRLISRLEYNNLFGFGVNYRPTVIWSHDLYGTAIQPISNFSYGTMTWLLINDFELSQRWSTQVYYQGSTGGQTRNYLRDKDNIGFIVNYSF